MAPKTDPASFAVDMIAPAPTGVAVKRHPPKGSVAA